MPRRFTDEENTILQDKAKAMCAQVRDIGPQETMEVFAAAIAGQLYGTRFLLRDQSPLAFPETLSRILDRLKGSVEIYVGQMIDHDLANPGTGGPHGGQRE